MPAIDSRDERPGGELCQALLFAVGESGDAFASLPNAGAVLEVAIKEFKYVRLRSAGLRVLWFEALVDSGGHSTLLLWFVSSSLRNDRPCARWGLGTAVPPRSMGLSHTTEFAGLPGWRARRAHARFGLLGRARSLSGRVACSRGGLCW